MCDLIIEILIVMLLGLGAIYLSLLVTSIILNITFDIKNKKFDMTISRKLKPYTETRPPKM